MVLCKRHRPRVKPNIHHVLRAHKFSTAIASERHLVYIRPVQIQLALFIRRQFTSAFFFEFFYTAYNFDFFACFTRPHRKRSPPVSLARNCPVFYFTEPFSEAPIPNMRRLPIYFFILADEFCFYFGI